METKSLLKHLIVSILGLACFNAFPQQQELRLVGKFSMPYDIISKDYAERFSIIFYDNHRFKYSPISALYGIVDIYGDWTMSGDTVILNTPVNELEMDCMVYLEYPMDYNTFKVLERVKGSPYCFRNSDSTQNYFFKTADNDTITKKADDKGLIMLPKNKIIDKIWVENLNLCSNEVFMPTDDYLNFFVLKYSPIRQFRNEKWVLKDENTIIPFERKYNRLASFELRRDLKWDRMTPYEETQSYPSQIINCGLLNHKQYVE